LSDARKSCSETEADSAADCFRGAYARFIVGRALCQRRNCHQSQSQDGIEYIPEVLHLCSPYLVLVLANYSKFRADMISPRFRYALVFYSLETRLLLRAGNYFYKTRSFKNLP
jgi:hypothetical protein